MSLARLAAGAIALGVAACAVTPKADVTLPNLQSIPAAFEMSGRIAVRQGTNNEIARLRWTHRPAADTWVIASPLGNEVARIESDRDGATISQGGVGRHAESFAALTQDFLGVPLEPQLLAGWLHAQEGELPASDWKVTLEQRQPAGNVTIARILSATRGDVSVRLVVDDYKVLEP